MANRILERLNHDYELVLETNNIETVIRMVALCEENCISPDFVG